MDAADTQPTAFRFQSIIVVNYPKVRIPAQPFSHATVGIIARQLVSAKTAVHARTGGHCLSNTSLTRTIKNEPDL